MDNTKRKVVIAGNWKMNLGPQQAANILEDLLPKVAGAECDVVLCVPFVDLGLVELYTRNTLVGLGAQNCHWAENGAFTGEVSAPMLREVGASHVIVGHSERRQYFGETDGTVNARTKAALAAGLVPIVCVGETLEQREAGSARELCEAQIAAALEGIPEEDLKKLVVAYEPVWAIGTGRTATAGQADEACGWLRNKIASLYGEETAEGSSILYGGSMNAGNAEELLGQPHVDGGLIGGASLKVDDFSTIVEIATKLMCGGTGA